MRNDPGAAALSAAEVREWRTRFPILQRSVYLINNSLGAMPATVPESLSEFARLWGERGVEAWTESWLPELRRVADLLGELIGAPAGTVTLHQNVATLTSIVASAIDFSGKRNRVVMTDLEWPSHRYLFDEYQRSGVKVELVPTDGLAVDVERLIGAIDERTAFVPLSHVVFRTSSITDVAPVARHAKEVGAVCMVDGYHATGHMPVDVQSLGVDLYVGGSVKWLCGGPGVGYLYAHPDIRERLRPREVGWLGHARPFGFEDAWEPAPGALGWLGGTPSIPAIYSAREGYDAILAVGPARIRATSMPLTARLVEGALERGIEVRTPQDPSLRAGAVTLDMGDGTEAASRRLIERGIMVDYRPGAGIRVGPHFFNTVEECDALLDGLANVSRA